MKYLQTLLFCVFAFIAFTFAEEPVQDETRALAWEESSAPPAAEKENILAEANILREEGIAQRRSGNIFLTMGIISAVAGIPLFAVGAIQDESESNSTCNFGGCTNENTSDDKTDTKSTLMMLGGTALTAMGAAFILAGVVKKKRGNRKIREADNRERMAFDFTPVIDIQNQRFGARFSAAF